MIYNIVAINRQTKTREYFVTQTEHREEALRLIPSWNRLSETFFYILTTESAA